MFLVDISKLASRERYLLRRLEREYTPEIARDILKPLLTQTSPVSLRALDWAVVNWAKKHNIVCSSLVPGESTNIHYAYRNTLGFWKRRLFDPFRRRSRIIVCIGAERHETTLGQANFALWTYKSGVLAYVLTHIEEIEDDMNEVSQRQKKDRRDARNQGTRKRRTELTSTPKGMCVAYTAPSRIVFE